MPTPQSGLIYILNAALTGKTLYAMLVNVSLTNNFVLSAAAAQEVSGNGYTRLGISFNSASADSEGFATLVSSPIQFNASGGNIGPFLANVITDVAAGSTGSIISFYNYAQPQVIQSGAGLSINYPMQLQSPNSNTGA